MMMQINKDRFNEMLEEMCEDYCFYSTVSKSDDVLSQHCAECPLNNIECDDFWEQRKNK